MSYTFETAVGVIEYPLLNDVMFHIVMQRSKRCLRGLIKSLLGLKEEEITDIQVLNPIHFGDTIEDKEIILDVEIELANNKIINIEVQVDAQTYWTNRSLFYASKLLASHNPGKSYRDMLDVTHIGILNFHLFDESEGFYANYYLQNPRTGKVFSDKLRICVLDLKRIELATEEDIESGLVYWARAFRAKTWEEIQRLAEINNLFGEVGTVMYTASTEQEVKDYLRRREIAQMDYNTGIVEAEERGEERGEQRGIEIGEQRGIEIGREQLLISLICKKLRKGKTAAQIAEETEESFDYIQSIVAEARAFAPGYKEEDVLQFLSARGFFRR